MRNCGQIIERAIKRQNVKQKDLADYLDMAPQNISKILRKESLDTQILERICRFLNLDPADFFDYRPDYAGGNIKVGDIEQTALLGTANVAVGGQSADIYERLLTEKDRLIDEKDKRIQILERLLSLHEANPTKPTSNQ